MTDIININATVVDPITGNINFPDEYAYNDQGKAAFLEIHVRDLEKRLATMKHNYDHSQTQNQQRSQRLEETTNELYSLGRAVSKVLESLTEATLICEDDANHLEPLQEHFESKRVRYPFMKKYQFTVNVTKEYSTTVYIEAPVGSCIEDMESEIESAFEDASGIIDDVYQGEMPCGAEITDIDDVDDQVSVEVRFRR